MKILDYTNAKRKFHCNYCGFLLTENNGGIVFGVVRPHLELAYHSKCLGQNPEQVYASAQRITDKFFDEHPEIAPLVRPKFKANFVTHSGCVRCGADVLSDVDGAILTKETGGFTVCTRCLNTHQMQTLQLLESAISQLPKQRERRVDAR